MASPWSDLGSPWLDMAPLDSMKSFARKLVSKKKRRFKQHGFNLDLSYITPRIIAMGFPCEGAESMYRNDISEVFAFLTMFHENHYKVFNLCAERTYDPTKLGGNVEWIPCSDHNPAPTATMFLFCERAYDWLVADASNVIVVHCKAGKGRTGLMVCAYLLYSRECSDPVTAIQYYGEKRTKNGKGVTISSQRRYLFYFYDLWKHGPRNIVPLVISRISLYSNLSLKCDIVICIACNGGNGSYKLNPILESQHAGSITNLVREGKYTTFFFSEVRILGDVKVTVYDGRSSSKPIFYFWFNTAFVDGKLFTLASRSELDKPSKHLDEDTKGIWIPFRHQTEWRCKTLIRFGKTILHELTAKQNFICNNYLPAHVFFSSRLSQKLATEDVLAENETKNMEQLTKQLSTMNRVTSSMFK